MGPILSISCCNKTPSLLHNYIESISPSAVKYYDTWKLQFGFAVHKSHRAHEGWEVNAITEKNQVSWAPVTRGVICACVLFGRVCVYVCVYACRVEYYHSMQNAYRQSTANKHKVGLSVPHPLCLPVLFQEVIQHSAVRAWIQMLHHAANI